MNEEQLLASVDASLKNQDAYEVQVLREATHQWAPRLTGLGFPRLESLAPSYNQQVAAKGKNSSYNPSDLPHFHAVLARIRRKLEENEGESSEDEKTLLYMKEQMILSYLSTVAKLPPEDLPIRPEMERREERERSESLHRARAQPPKSVANPTRPLSTKQAGIRPRVPLMQRRKEENEKSDREKGDDDHDAVLRPKEELLQLRRERQRRMRERRKRWNSCVEETDSSESERELEDEAPRPDEEEEKKQTDDIINEETKDGDLMNGAESETFRTTCPLCQETVAGPDPAELDVALAAHMEACQARRPTRRSTRGKVEVNHLISTRSAPTNTVATKTRTTSRKRPRETSHQEVIGTFVPALDDLELADYEDRVDDWISQGIARMKEMKEQDRSETPPGAEEYPGGLQIPEWVNNRLFGYQREGLRWMWELHQQQVGGIVGDEMGLGKTVQVSSFLGTLAASRQMRSVVIIAPATMLQHWLKELAVWAPGLRRVLIHTSGESDGVSRNISMQVLKSLAKWLRQSRSEKVNEAIDEDDWQTTEPHAFCGTGYAVVTTYENFRRNADVYTGHDWSYIVLDEAQKIRNPDADITWACKRIKTPHRLAMSGTIIGNDLKELWSLFDFVFPGRLGTLPAFEQEFSDPIRRGGYSNASPMQVQLAYRCALMLKDLIQPFLLRRQKKEIKEVNRMPGKTEHVLFCRLSQRQRQMYEVYLKSDEVLRVIAGSTHLFAVITMLRKICNHPDLVCEPGQAALDKFLSSGGGMGPVVNNDDDDDDGDSDDEIVDETSLIERSGKLEVLSKILPLWHEQGHRVLIFCQWRKMLSIIQRFMMLKGWKFGRLDGATNVASRQRLVDEFNTDDSYFAMLCTTRTGGVGLNLTGADRIILYDPDWNPQTDAQARERAWRFGQEREVTIYRLITAGTVEEKIYQRQIFKTALSNKVLQDPRQRRFFSQKDLRDLFSLGADSGSLRSGGEGLTETGKVTSGVGVIDPDEEAADGAKDDNQETLKKIMMSKGLAGVFDHHYVERDSTRKTTTVREMEEKAKQAAKEALNSLKRSVEAKEASIPTSAPRRFGAGNSAGKFSSTQLLAGLRQRNDAVETVGASDSSETKRYADITVRIKEFVRRRKPSTDEILAEFDDVPSSDVAIFRRLLQSVALINNGKWYLK